VIFTTEELTNYRRSFLKYDVDRSGELELFELHQMYEEAGIAKTNTELRQLIVEAKADKTLAEKGGISYREYLSTLLKEKKGLVKGPFKGFAGIAIKVHLVEAKTHDDKKIGKSANVFEQKYADIANSDPKTIEAQVRAEIASKRDPVKAAEAKVREEQRLADIKEKARKEAVAARLAKLQANIQSSAPK